MTTITARGWPGLDNYKSPEGGGASASLRNYDLWLVPYFKDGKGAVIAMSGSVELARIDLPDEQAIWEWCDPRGTVKTQPYGLWRAYQPNVAIVGWDLGYTFGQITEYWSTGRDKTYSIWPYGWGRARDRGRYGCISPHRPPLMMRPRTKGWQVWWGKPKSGPPGRYGKWVNGKLFTGNFIDLQSVCFAFGLNQWFDPHLGYQPMESALRLVAIARCLDDNQAKDWFGGTLDTRTLSSPATLAKGLLQRIGVAAPLDRFVPSGLSQLDRWVSHLSGGWLEANPDYIGHPTPVVPFDLRAAYALSWCLTDCWSILTADHLEERDMTWEVQVALEGPEIIGLDPIWWKRFGCTLVEVLPDGEPWPVELGNLHRAYVPLTSKRPMWFPWQTVVAAAVLSGRTPNVLQAIRLVASGKQHLHNVDILPGIRVRAHQDPVPILVQAREQYPVLKTVVNSLTWGIMSEFHSVGKSTETPGPWCFPPIAATVAAGPRLLLALLDRMVRDAGGAVVYRDTDSLYITGLGGSLAVWNQISTRFKPLDQGWGVWKWAPLCHMLVRDRKKYLLFREDGSLIDWKESNLRGTYEDPPGHPNWTKDYHERVVKKLIDPSWRGMIPAHWLVTPAVRRLQNKPGCGGSNYRPGAYVEQYNGDSLLTRLRLWHQDQHDQGPKEIIVSSIRYKGTASDAITANREGRAISRPEYGRTCPGCGELLAEHCRKDKVYCSGRCKKHCQRRAS